MIPGSTALQQETRANQHLLAHHFMAQDAPSLRSPSDAETPVSKAIRKRMNPARSILRGVMPTLVLGSMSTARKRVLESLGGHVPFTVEVADIDEKAIRHDDAAQLVLLIAKAKSKAILSRRERQAYPIVLITADQVVVGPDGVVREKPGDEAEARAMIKSYAGATARTVSSVVVHNTHTGAQACGVDIATIAFDASLADDAVIDSILKPAVAVNVSKGLPARRDPTSTSAPGQESGSSLTSTSDAAGPGHECVVYTAAGALMIEHPAMTSHIVSLDGAIDSVQGLPFKLTARLVSEVSSLKLLPPDSAAAAAVPSHPTEQIVALRLPGGSNIISGSTSAVSAPLQSSAAAAAVIPVDLTSPSSASAPAGVAASEWLGIATDVEVSGHTRHGSSASASAASTISTTSSNECGGAGAAAVASVKGAPLPTGADADGASSAYPFPLSDDGALVDDEEEDDGDDDTGPERDDSDTEDTMVCAKGSGHKGARRRSAGCGLVSAAAAAAAKMTTSRQVRRCATTTTSPRLDEEEEGGAVAGAAAAAAGGTGEQGLEALHLHRQFSNLSMATEASAVSAFPVKHC